MLEVIDDAQMKTNTVDLYPIHFIVIRSAVYLTKISEMIFILFKRYFEVWIGLLLVIN